MKRLRIAVAVGAALASCLALTSPAAAAPAAPQPTAPAPSFSDPNPSHEELTRMLLGIERLSRGRVDVRTIGRSNEGRPIHLATVGHGRTRLLYITQQHGNEPLGTPAAVQLLWTLGVHDSAWTRRLRDRVTLSIVVRANPDGAARNWRENYDPEADPEYGQRGRGYDINRYHNPDLAPRDNPVPEAAAIRRAWNRLRPHIVVDYHGQGRYAFPDGREITASIMWPTNPEASRRAVARSKQVAVLNYLAMSAAGAVVSQYPGGDYEGIARNAYGILGSASLLVELSNLPAERTEFQIRTAYVSMLATVQAAADRSVWRLDPAWADRIPPRGPALPGSSGELERSLADAA